jgi:putative tricarboxylic transport membrane protein
VISAGLVICGLLLTARGLRRPAPGGRLIAFDDWARNPVIVIRFLSVPIGLLFYVLTSDFLGFHIAASLAMLAWLLVFGMKPLPAVAVAIAFPIIMHLAFYKILRVPLPWGVLTNVMFP